MTKLVSIITPVHNSEQFLGCCIESVLTQTYENWEHILVDDCSTDDSAALILSYAKKDPRIIYIPLTVNSGAGVARNKAIERAKGGYIAFLDSDDKWNPEKLQLQLTFMEQNNCHFSFSSYDTIDEDGNSMGRIVKARPVITYKKALYKNPIGCLTAMYSVEYFGKQYMSDIRKRQDYALWLKLLKRTNAMGLQQVLASYRNTSNSVSSNKLDLISYEWRIYREVEGLSLVKSLFYLLSAIIIKMKNYF
jgi:teichuronic acid biosynthesis glycosyltransferase TuaG